VKLPVSIDLLRGAGAAADGALAHRDALEAIARAAFPGQGLAVEQELARAWTRLWIARDEAAARGYLLGWHVVDELHVLQVAASEETRRRGVGAALVREALDYAATSRVRLVLLEVRRSNVAAIGLYRKFGFSAVNVRAAYYADTGEDAVEMALELEPATGLVVTRDDEVLLGP
jgi:ribosomal-protein-alanine N-acetyltransferase